MLTIDPATELVIPLSELGKKIGMRIARSTVKEWINRGRKNCFTGQRVHLESIQMPGGEGTSVEAYHRFIEAMNAE